jgi:hypothetical protein
MSRLLYVLQVWHGDVDMAAEVARLHAEITDGTPYQDVDAMLVYRRDCPRPRELEELLSRSFSVVRPYRSRRHETGFPAGPNGVWCDMMQHVAAMHRSSEWNYDCVLTTEADAIPLVRDWPQRLLAAWDRAESMVAGCWHPNGEHLVGHINGNALFDPLTVTLDPRLAGCSTRVAWDTYLANVFHQLGWEDIPEIRNLYQARNVEPFVFEHLLKDDCAWLHGVKDSTARDWVRRRLVSSQKKSFSILPQRG